MTLLRDMRLLLIVGLAILCLLALRLCSSEYQPNTIGSVGSSDTVASESATSDTQAIVSNTGSASTDADNVSDSKAPAAESTDAPDTQPADENSQATDADDSGSDLGSASGSDSGSDSGTADENTGEQALETDAENSDQPSQDADAASAAGAADEADAAVAVSVAESESIPFEVVPSAIAEFNPRTVKPIVIDAPAENGTLIPDLQSDIDTVKDGVMQYNDKLDLINTLIEEVTNPGQ